MLSERKKDLEKQGYKIVGNHSAVKLCLWCKKSIKNQDVCYKKKFYNIDSWRCIQATVTLDLCNLKCEWCWRDINTSYHSEFNDNPNLIIDGLIERQKELLEGFFGYNKSNKERLSEALKPKHIALSLTGETCLYPRLPELIKLIHKKNMTSFVVTNGTFPEMIKKLTINQPTQLYITLPAPDEKTFLKICKPINKNAWDKIEESLSLLKKFNRPTVRLTLAKKINMFGPEKYAKILQNVKFKFLEVKAAMTVGYSRYRMEYEQIPLHEEIVEFSRKICELNNLKIIDEKKNSRVTLIMEKDYKNRKIIS